MNKFLHLKHWQLFGLLIGVPMLLQIILVSVVFTQQNPSAMLVAFPLLMIVFTGLFFGWFYALGTRLHEKLPASVHMNLTRFKIFLIIPALYIFLLCLFMAPAMRDPQGLGESSLRLAAVIFPVHLFSMFCIFYCLYFIAKELKSVEWQRAVTFSDFAGEFLLIWFFPIGVWIIQPRINKLFDGSTQNGTDIFHPTY